MVLWEEWLNNVASAMAIDATSAGIIVSCLFMLSFILLVASLHGGGFAIMFTGLISLILFTVVGWMPIYAMLLLSLVIAGVYSGMILRLITRRR